MLKVDNSLQIPEGYTGSVYVDMGKHIRWYVNGKIHREDGPAIIYDDGSWSWFYNGFCHRLDGPAVFRKVEKSYTLTNLLTVATPEGWISYHLNGKQVSITEWSTNSLVIRNKIEKICNANF